MNDAQQPFQSTATQSIFDRATAKNSIEFCLPNVNQTHNASFYTRNLHTIRFHSLVWSLFAWKSHLKTNLQHKMELQRTEETFITVAIATSRHSKSDSKRNRLTSYHRMCVQNYEMVLLFRCVARIPSHLFVMWSIVFHLCVRVPEHMCTANEISIYHITMSSSWLWYGAFITKQRRETK